MTGDIPIHPTSEHNPMTGTPILTSYGLTYRQWLIGMALQGVLANSRLVGNKNIVALYVLKQVDTLLEQLDNPTD